MRRCLHHYLDPFSSKKLPLKPNTIYHIAPGIENEELLANACEPLTSAKVMANDFAGYLDGPQRHMMLGIAQLIMLGELAVNRALDNLELPAD